MVKCKVCNKTYYDNIAVCTSCGAPIYNNSSSALSLSEELVKKRIIESKRHINKIEGVSVPYITLFIFITVVGYGLGILANMGLYDNVVLFENSFFGKYNINSVINILSCIFRFSGMLYIYYCIKKVVKVTENSMSSLVNACILFLVIRNVIMIFAIMASVYEMSNFGTKIITNIFNYTVYGVYIIYIILCFVFSRRIIETFEGALKNLGTFLYLLSWYRLFYTILSFYNENDGIISILLQVIATSATFYFYLFFKRIIK